TILVSDWSSDVCSSDLGVETRQVDRQRWSPSPERLRNLRALEALELAATPQARQLLQKLADGAPEAFVTREAEAILERTRQRTEIGRASCRERESKRER